MLKYSDINQKEIFKIIDKVLPLEYCIYHQIIPLLLEENKLTVAMVRPQDELILDYLKSILPSKKHSLKIEKISPETHQIIISSYQKYSSTFNKSAEIKSEIAQKIREEKEENQPIENQENITVKSKISKRINKKINNNSKMTISFKIDSNNQDKPLETLTELTAEELWPEILTRLLQKGIGRLFLERKQDFGKIIITHNGIVTSSLENVNLVLFEKLMKAVKILANIGDNPLDKSRQIEIERTYEQKRLLLRFQLFPGQFGEEGTIQILRDKALSFYQEKQMDILGENVLNLTKQLDKKLQQIQDLQRINPTELEVLPQLRVIQAKILEKLELLDH